MHKWMLSLLIFLGACHSGMAPLKNQNSSYTITTEDLKKWDDISEILLKDSPLPHSGDGFRLYTYLYTAQKAFADTSFQITSDYKGTLDAISYSVLRLFFPNYTNASLKTDAYSEELTERLMPAIKERFQEEQKQIKSVKTLSQNGGWHSDKIPADRFVPSMEPWSMRRRNQFQTPRPPKNGDKYWQDQLQQMLSKKESATEQQKQRSLYWENLIEPKATDWRLKAVTYMREKNIPFELQLIARANLTVGLMDALIAVFHDKFNYMIARPNMIDKQVEPLFTTPNHPSYPSAHSTIASAAATILCYYFPENGKEWRHLAYESSESRLWGGIHYPIDLEVGKWQGRQIGELVLFGQ